jgi:hypothetical protein
VNRESAIEKSRLLDIHDSRFSLSLSEILARMKMFSVLSAGLEKERALSIQLGCALAPFFNLAQLALLS